MPNKTAPDDVFMVAVIVVMPWKGKCADDAANKAAAVLGLQVQDTADFYGKSYMTWGAVDEK